MMTMNPCSQRELEVVRRALSRILQEENPLPQDQHRARELEICRRIHGVDHEQQSSYLAYAVDHHEQQQPRDLTYADLESNYPNSVHHGKEGGLDSMDKRILSKLLHHVSVCVCVSMRVE